MLPSGPMAVTAILLLQASAEIETGARLDARIGDFPTGGQQSQSSVMAVAVPRLGLDWFAGTDVLSADLSSRILWRPVPSYSQRPLFLETLVLEHRARPTLRSEWRLTLQASYGEQDYTSLSQQLEDQPTLPLSTTMLMASGTAGLQWRASRRIVSSLSLAANHRRSLDTSSGASSAATGAYTLPTQTMVSAAPALQLGMSRRLVCDVSAPFFDYDIEQNSGGAAKKTHLNMVALQPQLGATGQLTRRHRLHLAAGLTYARPVSNSATNIGDRVSPLGQLDLDSDLYRSSSTLLQSAVRTGVTWLMDPVLGSGRWRAVASVSLTGQMGLRWSARASAAFVTDISRPPPTSAPVNGTLFSANCALTYRWPRVLIAELGGRFAERAPRLGSPGFEWYGRELWAFLSLNVVSRASLTGVHPTQGVVGR